MNVMAPDIRTRLAEPQPFRLTIEDYELLDRAGAFRGRKVQLINGAIVEMAARFQPHVLLKNRLSRRLQDGLEALSLPFEAMAEASVALSQDNLPDPDIVVGTFMPVRAYMGLDQVALLVEIADTSLRLDMGEKRDLYASCRIPEYWVVDVNARTVHQFWSPNDGRFAQSRTVALEGPLASATIADLTVDGTGLL